MKNFIEVGKTQDEQEQQVKKWIKENGVQIIAGIVLGLGGIWGFDAYEDYQYQQSIDARSLYLNTNSATIKSLESNHSDSSYLQQALLMQAKTAAKKQNYTLALQHLSTLVNDKNTLIANIASMRMASLQLEMSNFSQAIATLDNQAVNGFEGLYNQLKGDIYVADNKIKQAKEHYKLALTQISKDSELQSLINIKLVNLNQ